MNKQRFENTFFQLVAVHNDKAARFKFANEKVGAAAFTYLFGEISGATTDNRKTENIRDAYSSIVKDQRVLDYKPYINNLYSILSVIHDSSLVSLEEKPFYYQILACQLSNGEMNLAWIESFIRNETIKWEEAGFFTDVPDPIIPKRGTQSPPTFIR